MPISGRADNALLGVPDRATELVVTDVWPSLRASSWPCKVLVEEEGWVPGGVGDSA